MSSIRRIDPDEGPTETGRGRLPRVPLPLLVVLCVALGVAVIVGGGSVLGVGPKPTTTSGPTTGAPHRDGSLTPNVGEVPGVPGLLRGTATVELGNTDALFGVPIGWSRDLDGAVGAAMNYSGATLSLVGLLPDTRHELADRIYTPAGRQVSMMSDAQVADLRAKLHMDEFGNVVRGGVVSDTERMWAEHYPRFGAYRVVEVTRTDGQLQRVDVEVWFPAIAGPGTPDKLDEVLVGWVNWDVGLEWSDGDWRIYAIDVDRDQPTPADGRRTNQPWSTVRDLLGPGWAVPADGTDRPYPGAVLTK